MATCLACGRDLAGDFVFCPFCGASVATPERPAAERERRVVTVLFCDLVGFTSSSEQSDVEDVERQLSAYHQHVRERVEAFGGVVEKFVGDAVMAVFGAPVAHEDDAERAVRAGLSVVEELTTLPGTRVRVGINTGEALVAVGARPEAGESYVVGDVVNTAARLQGSAPIDSVVVGEVTHRTTDRIFEYAELEAAEAKGKAQPVPRWQALAAKARFGTDLMRDLDTPMVGRSLELAALVNAFDRAGAGGTQLVTVVAEAGVGKSRLVAELFAYTDRLPALVRWRQGRCLPYGDGIAFWALAEVVKAHLGIYDGDSDEQVRTKLDRLGESGVDPWVVASLSTLLGLAGTAMTDRDATFEAWRQFIESLADEQPAVIVLEDLHWADDSLLDFVEYFADWSRGARLLIVGTARPELLAKRPTWASGLTNASMVRLTPLSPSETSDLILSRLGNSELPAAVRNAVVERSGGNPLYAEEFVRMVRDRPDTLRAELDEPRTADRAGDDAVVTLPETVQALIAARLDTLPSDARDLLLAASVVGKVFWAGAVSNLSGVARAEVERRLHDLVRNEMVRTMRRSSLPGDVEYAFTHALIRDVAYQQLTREGRVERHLACADWLVDTSGDRVSEVAEVLVHHALSALELAEAIGDDALVERARSLLRKSCVSAAGHLRGLDQARAQTYADRALELVDAETPPGDEAAALMAWVYGASQLLPMEDVMAAVDRTVSLRRAAGDPDELARALMFAASQARVGHQNERTNRYRSELQDLLERLTDPVVKAQALAQVASDAELQGLGRGAQLSAQAVSAVTAAGEPTTPEGADAWTAAHNACGLSLLRRGEKGSVEHFDEAIRVARRWNPGRALELLDNRAQALTIIEGPGLSLAVYDEAIAEQEDRGRGHGAGWVQAAALVWRLQTGRLEETLELATLARARLEAFGSVVEVEARATLVSAAAELGCSEDVADLGERLVRYAWDELADASADRDTQLIACGGALDHLVAGGRAGDAEAMLRRLLSRSLEIYELYARLPRLVRVARAVSPSDAEAVMEPARAILPRTLAMGEAAGRYADGLLTIARRPREAAEELAVAAAQFATLGAGLESAYSLAGEGEARMAAHDPTRGLTVLETAAAAFDSMGAVPAAQRCRELLATQ